ncbi:MAG TPA: DUF2398 family protein, partial [Anaerovoracaceae bacterium]|nr:DUF2398 family protein [Anaerovoracaceae bacterium]
LGDYIDELDIGALTRRFALRELLLTPSFHESDYKAGYDYLKQKPQVATKISDQMEKYLGIHVAYTNYTAFSTVDVDTLGVKQAFLIFASNQSIKMVLSFNTILREYMESAERDVDDSLIIPEEQFELLFAGLYEKEVRFWTVEYKDKSRDYCYADVKDRMQQLKFIKISDGYVKLLPQIAKIAGVFDIGEKDDDDRDDMKPKKSEKDIDQISFI